MPWAPLPFRDPLDHPLAPSFARRTQSSAKPYAPGRTVHYRGRTQAEISRGRRYVGPGPGPERPGPGVLSPGSCVDGTQLFRTTAERAQCVADHGAPLSLGARLSWVSGSPEHTVADLSVQPLQSRPGTMQPTAPRSMKMLCGQAHPRTGPPRSHDQTFISWTRFVLSCTRSSVILTTQTGEVKGRPVQGRDGRPCLLSTESGRCV